MNSNLSLKKNLQRFFPVPNFLSMPSVGLHVGEEAVRFVEFEDLGKSLFLKRYGKKDLTLSEEKTDDFLESDELKNILVSIKKESKINYIKASLPEEKAYLFKTEIPKVDPDDIRNTIEFKLEENVPLQSSQSVFDYKVLEKESSDHLDVSVSVLPYVLVDKYLKLFKSSGLRPVVFEVEALAIARAIIPRGNKDTILVINFGERKTGLYVVKEGVVFFTSTVPIGGTSLTNAIKKHLSVDFPEAQKIRKEVGVVRDKKNIDLFFSMASTLSVLRDEINRILIYWQSRQERDEDLSSSVSRIILCGTDSNMAGFREYLEANIRIDSEYANVWINAFDLNKFIPPISFSESLGFATAIGLALPKKDK